MSKVLTDQDASPDNTGLVMETRFQMQLSRLRRITDSDKVFFTQNLGVMLSSGLSAARAIATLAQQTQNTRFRNILVTCAERVEQGETIAAALSQYPSVFEPVYVNMVTAGETSGKLETVLKELANQQKNSHSLKTNIRNALLYPIIILCAMSLLGFAMVVFVIPKLLSIFEEVNIQLPLPTRMLIAITNFLNNYLFLILPGTITLIAGIVWLAHRGKGKFLWHRIILRLPIVGGIMQKVQLAKLCRTLATLLKTDIPIVRAITLTANTMKNVHYQQALLDAAHTVEDGATLSASLKTHHELYTPVMQQMVLVGEETGKLDAILEELALFYEDDVAGIMKTLPSIIEPALIVVLGLAIGGMAVAVLLPLFSLSDAF